jgi:hypothetical protein
MGYFNMIANLSMTEFGMIARSVGWRNGKSQLFYVYLMGMLAPALVSDAIVRGLGNQWDDEDDDGYLDEFAEWFFGSQLRMIANLIPWGGATYSLMTAGFDNKPYNDNVQTAPSFTALESATVGVSKGVVRAIDPRKEITGQNVKDFSTLLSLMTGVPFVIIGRPAAYWTDVSNDKVRPGGPASVVFGTVTGVAGEAKK